MSLAPALVIPGRAQREPGTQGVTMRRAFAPRFRVLSFAEPRNDELELECAEYD